MPSKPSFEAVTASESTPAAKLSQPVTSASWGTHAADPNSAVAANHPPTAPPTTSASRTIAAQDRLRNLSKDVSLGIAEPFETLGAEPAGHGSAGRASENGRASVSRIARIDTRQPRSRIESAAG